MEVESIVDLIRESIHCLGLRCDDIGIHDSEKNGMMSECKDPDFDAHLAGYRPAHDVYQVRTEKNDLSLQEFNFRIVRLTVHLYLILFSVLKIRSRYPRDGCFPPNESIQCS